jgi:polyisoprenoid-binding protein YceI
MKKLLVPVLIAISWLASAFTPFTVVNWQIVEGYAIEGRFAKMTGDLTFDETNVAASKFAVTVDVASINTGNWLKNRHAKSDKWFHADRFPTIMFVSNAFSKTATGYQVAGTLELHGVKKPISIPFTFVNNQFKGHFSIQRMDFGIGTMEGMSKKVSNEIKLDISVSVSKK